MSRPKPATERLLTPGEVAAIFGVDTQTVTRWERAGKLAATRTLGGHRRFRQSEIREVLRHMPKPRPPQPRTPPDAKEQR